RTTTGSLHDSVPRLFHPTRLSVACRRDARGDRCVASRKQSRDAIQRGALGVRVAALVESFEHVCCRYRLRAFESLWAREGVAITYHPIPHSWWGRLNLAKVVRGADVVV